MTNSIKKITKRDRFNQLLELDAVQADVGLVEFINHEIELLDNKSAKAKNGERKLTKAQLENVAIANVLAESMEDGKYYTITDMIKNIECCAELTNQKTTAIVNRLIADGVVTRTEDKGRAYFCLSH